MRNTYIYPVQYTLISFLVIFGLSLSFSPVLHAQWVWSPELGKFVSPDDDARDTSSEQYDYAMELYKDKNYDKSAQELEDIVSENPQSKIASEALFKLAQIYEENGDYHKSLKEYQKLIEHYPNNDRFEEVIEKEFIIGNIFLSGKKAKVFGVEIRPSLPIAAEAFEHIITHAPYSSFGDKAHLKLGLTKKKHGKFEDAIVAFTDLVDKYPQSDLLEKARYEIAETSYLQSIAYQSDQKALESAASKVDAFIERFPDTLSAEKATKLRQEIDDKNAQKNFEIGAFYEKTQQLSSALIYYRDVAARYSHTTWGSIAEEKIRSLENPVEFAESEAQKIAEEIKQLKAQKDSLSSGDDAVKDKVKQRIKSLESRRDSLDKQRQGSVKNIMGDIKRRKKELKEKYEKLEQKREENEGNTSPDFNDAMNRWKASLDEEAKEIARLEGKYGAMDDGGISWTGWIPYMGDDEPKKTPKVEKSKMVEEMVSEKPMSSEDLSEEMMEKAVMSASSNVSMQKAMKAPIENLPPAITSSNVLNTGKEAMPADIRKEMKTLEKDIRARYQQIEDRHKAKKQLLAQLENQISSSIGSKFVGAVVLPFKAAKTFIMGSGDSAIDLLKRSEGSSSDSVQLLRRQIIDHSLAIESLSQDIFTLQSLLESVRDLYAAEGETGYKTSLVDVPHVFLLDAITSAKEVNAYSGK